MAVNLIGISMLVLVVVSAIGVVIGIVKKNKKIYVPFLILFLFLLAIYVADLYFALR